MLRSYQGLDQMLEAGAVAAWDDLIHAGTPGLIHIKYHLADHQCFANLQVWTSETRGRWLLVCEYSGVVSEGSASLVFSNGYRSDLLSHFLTFVIEHQNEFAAAPELNRDSLVQVQLPNENEKLQALKLVNEVQTHVVHAPSALAAAS
jgi:hypothetical protein